MIVVSGNFLLTLTSRLKLRSKTADTFYWVRSSHSLSFLPTLDLKVFFSEKADSDREVSDWLSLLLAYSMGSSSLTNRTIYASSYFLR